MFKNLTDKLFIKVQVKEATSFLNVIKVMDGDELGLLVAMVADIKNQFLKNNIHLDDPFTLHAVNPTLVVDMVNQVKKLQNSNQQVLASGFMVWIFSLRAGNDFKLRDLARKIWAELERGFPFVDQAMNDAELWLPNDLNISGYDQFPDGLTPKPL